MIHFLTMNSNFHKKAVRGRNISVTTVNSNDNKAKFRGQENYSNERRKILSDTTFYNIARFLLGNEVQILTKNDRIEGVLRGFDSSSLWLSKVTVYDLGVNDSLPMMRDLLEGKEVFLRNVLMIKVLSLNGRTDGVVVDQEISQRKQINKLTQAEDKNFVPYFDEDESQLDEEKDEDDLGISMKGDQGCWYSPEEMLKDNKTLFNLKSTYNDNMEEYTTQIDINDPKLQEKIERAEKLAREMESDSRRTRQIDDEDGEQDEEMRYSAVVLSSPKEEAPGGQGTHTPVKLNPNAPEFRPRQKQEANEQVDEMVVSDMSSVPDSMQHQQIIPRFAFQMTPQTVSTQPLQSQQYPGQRLVSVTPQWSVPMHTGQPMQYMYQHGPLIPQGYQARQITPEAGQGMLYSLGPFGTPFYMPQEHLSSSVSGEPGHMYATSIDTATQMASQLHQLRQPHLVPSNIPVLQQQQQLSGYYTQPSHAMLGQPLSSGHPNITHLVFNQPAHIQSPAAIQGYISNGRS